MSTTLANIRPANPAAIARAGEIIRAGGLVAFPTETVYGLGADATNDKAVAAIFEAKGRPAFNPLIVHVPDLAAAERLVEFTPVARELAAKFWPGALTLVLPRKTNSPVSLLASAGLDTIAVRVPAHPVAQSLLAAAKTPIAAPSANASGRISATTAKHVEDELHDKAYLILDGGPASLGIKSTVIGFDGDTVVLLRAGGVTRDEIEAIAGKLSVSADGKIASPGQLESHYAPNAAMRLNAANVGASDALLAFGPRVLSGARTTRNLSVTGDLQEAAANLFAMLRELDASGAATIAVMPIPETGLGEAINDRLRRAAAPRNREMIAADTLSRLKDAAGPKGWSEDANEIAPHLVEWRGKYQGKSALLLKPDNTERVSKILAICNETRTPIVPQGGNTGLVGGQIPFDGEVLLSLTRMNRVRHVDAAGMSLIVDAGVTLAAVQKAADDADRLFPLSLASEGSATIGGNISTNAGGVNVLRYGSARELVLGVEAVLADGRILDSLRTLRKDNTGYDLKQLFIGSEGTLGVVTAIALKLFPKPRERATALIAVRDPQAAIDLLSRLQEATGGMISAFELMPRLGIEFVLAHIPATSDPLSEPSPWYVLAEASGGAHADLQASMERALEAASGLVSDAVLAQNETQRAAFWKLRESMSEAQKPEGGSIKHDVSVPIKDIPAFLREGIAAVETLVPGVRPVPFGHLGDGNIHFNFSVPKDGDNAAYLARWEEIQHAVHAIVRRYGGSISAEHGVGVMKRDEIAATKSSVEIELMRALKRTLDPNDILNPRKVVAI